MSFCPTKDIHSVYLDNELPDVYKADYEKHVSQCPKCKQELAQLKAVRDVFQSDVKQITPQEDFVDKSYERLMIKMSYNKNTKKTKKPSAFRFTYIVSAAAAAFMLALFIPMGLRSKKNVVQPTIQPTRDMFPINNFGNNISLGSGNDAVVSGNMRDVLSGYGQTIAVDNLIDEIRDVDVLRPEFAKDNAISIRITIPKVKDIPMKSDLGYFGIVLSGNYEWNHLEE